MGFKWIPGEGVCSDRLTHMKNEMNKPLKLMGEAWFMGQERRVFTELDGNVDDLSTDLLQEILGEIIGGVGAFGDIDEWREWFGYLLPHLIPRSHEEYINWLYEEICSAFLQIDLDENNPNATVQYRDNVLHTLGQSLMESERWHDGSIVLGEILHPSNDCPAKIWGWDVVSGDLAASMILCLRLIETKDIDEWVESIFAIDCPYWRAQILTWYTGAKPLLEGNVHFPSQFDDGSPQITWSQSHYIEGVHSGVLMANQIIPDANLLQFNLKFEEALVGIDLDGWKNQILSISALRDEVGGFIENTKFRRSLH